MKVTNFKHKHNRHTIKLKMDELANEKMTNKANIGTSNGTWLDITLVTHMAHMVEHDLCDRTKGARSDIAYIVEYNV